VRHLEGAFPDWRQLVQALVREYPSEHHITDLQSSCSNMVAMVAAKSLLVPHNAKCRWISCRKNMGYHTMDPKIRTQEAVRVKLRSQRNTAMEASRCRRGQHTAERDTEHYPGSGPSW
jgi:hypothetical protein